MTAPRDVDRTIRAFLEPGPTDLPDRSFDEIRATIERTHQRTVIGPWRIETVSTFAKLAAATAAVIVFAIVGFQVLPGGGPGGEPSPTPSPAQTLELTPAPTVPPMPNGEIEPGRYAWTWPGGRRVAFDVPNGWIGKSGGIDHAPNTAREVGLANWFPGTWTEVTQVYDDACAASGALITIGPSSADLVSALDAQVGTSATVTELLIGGLPATRVDLAVEPGLDPATCRMGADGPVQIWFQDQGGYLAIWPDAAGVHGQSTVWSIDVDGDRLIFTTGSNPSSDDEAVAQVDAMIESITFE